MHLRRPALKKGGSIRIIRIMLNLLFNVINDLAKTLCRNAQKRHKNLTKSVSCGTRTRLRECDLVCEITVQSLSLHLR